MSEEGSGKIRIVKINDGTVIDHIRAGMALEVLKILRITGKEGNVVTLAMNITSSRIGQKDIVKVENHFLADAEVARIALVAPEATIIMKCPNPRCVTNKEREPIHSKYQVVSRNPIQLKCLYCWNLVEEEHILKEFTD